jgi:hypothetical protein
MELKVELHGHCDGVVDPAMLRGFALRGEDLEATAKELEEAYPVTSLERWNGVYGTALRGFWRLTAERIRLVASAQRERWREQNAPATDDVRLRDRRRRSVGRWAVGQVVCCARLFGQPQ